MVVLSKEIYELMFKQNQKMFPDDNRMKDVTDISGKEVRMGKDVFGNVLAFTESANLVIREALECVPGCILCPYSAFSTVLAYRQRQMNPHENQTGQLSLRARTQNMNPC